MATSPQAPPSDPSAPSDGPPPFEDADAILGELDAAERGFVLGVLLSGAGATTTSALEPPSRERCADALGAIGRLARAPRVRLTHALAHDVVPAVPAGIEEVDPSYLRAILDDEAPAIVALMSRDAPPALQAAVAASLAARAIAGGSPADRDTEPDADADTDPDLPAAFVPGARGGAGQDPRPGEAGVAPPATLVMSSAARDLNAVPQGDREVSPDLLAELRRAVLAKVVTVPPAAPGALPRSWIRRLATLPASELVSHLARQGAEVVGLSLQGSSGELLLRSAALVGPPFAEWMLAAGRRAPGFDAELGLDRSAARAIVAATRPASDPRETLARVGARAVGTRLISPSERGLGGIDTLAALAQRLRAGMAAELLAAAGVVGPTPGG